LAQEAKYDSHSAKKKHLVCQKANALRVRVVSWTWCQCQQVIKTTCKDSKLILCSNGSPCWSYLNKQTLSLSQWRILPKILGRAKIFFWDKMF